MRYERDEPERERPLERLEPAGVRVARVEGNRRGLHLQRAAARRARALARAEAPVAPERAPGIPTVLTVAVGHASADLAAVHGRRLPLEEGQVVVTGGQMKLRNGVPIVVNNTVQPANDSHPQPTDQ